MPLVDRQQRRKLGDAVAPEMTLSVHCHRLDDIQTAVRIAEEFGLKYSLEHCTEGRQIAAWLGAKKAFAAVGPMLTSRSKIELRNQSWQNPAVGGLDDLDSVIEICLEVLLMRAVVHDGGEACVDALKDILKRAMVEVQGNGDGDV